VAVIRFYRKIKEEETMGKKAFIVGINDYAPSGPGGPDLNGCVNDARDMANTLIICGFAPAAIRLCTDRCATKAGILSGLKWLMTGAKKGDSLVFYYSGHGSQVVDTSADEVDRKDEILCPNDINFENKVYISDDELRKICSTLTAEVNLEVILDSCHSGTGTRELAAQRDLPEENKVGIRYLEPPIDFTFHIDYRPDLKKKGILKPETGDREVVIIPGINHTLWAACRDYQTSQETNIGGTVRGVFTYHFCEVLRRTRGTIERIKLDAIVTGALSRHGYAQVPQLETSKPELKEKPFV
jgi:uncharacterized caspase-like protein